MAMRKLPDIAFIRECLDYDPDTGSFTWRERPREHFVNKRGWATWNARYAGKPAGWRLRAGPDVYWALTLNDVAFLAHRVAWFMVNDTDPAPVEIDHIDGDPLNNRIANLRLATRQQQAFNRQGNRTHTSTGAKGVFPYNNSGFYYAAITIGGKVHRLGTFPTIEEAAEAYQKASERLHGKFHRRLSID